MVEKMLGMEGGGVVGAEGIGWEVEDQEGGRSGGQG